MSPNTTSNLANVIRENSQALTDASSDFDPLIREIGDARFVLLGEASHGTHECKERNNYANTGNSSRRMDNVPRKL